MTNRLLTFPKWLWCLLVLQGLGWRQVESAEVKNPPNNPTTVQAQAKFFQDFFSVQLSPYKIEFGHVCEDPNTWEQRYESNDLKSHRHMGKVRWGDKKGGYGEHYWDLNHAGHTDDHNDHGYEGDDGSYDPSKDNSDDSYDEPTHISPNYQSDESVPYDPEKAPFDEAGRAKRHHKVKSQKRQYQSDDNNDNTEEVKPRKTKEPKQYKEHRQAEPIQSEEESGEEIIVIDDEKPKRKSNKPKKHETVPEFEELVQPEAHKLNEEQQHPAHYVPQQQYYVPQQPQLQYPAQFAPYEQSPAVRHYQAAVAGPRLYLEAATGRIVDKATGQAYVLQPVGGNNFN